VALDERPQAQQVRLAQVGTATVLWITQGQDTTAYKVQPIPHDFGQAAFRLSKADRGDGPGEVYEVLLDGPKSLCACKGFERHGMCKTGAGCRHIASLAALLSAGQLAPAPEPASVCPIDADALDEHETARLTPWDTI
jgi:hypothetical protein